MASEVRYYALKAIRFVCGTIAVILVFVIMPLCAIIDVFSTIEDYIGELLYEM